MKRLAAMLLFTACFVVSAAAETKYILVQSELNVRGRPSLGSEIHGRLFTGDSVNVVRKYRGWYFLRDLPSEEGCGWISEKYTVSEPVTELRNVQAIIEADGRVAIRDSVNGKRKSWVYPGDIVQVYGTSEVWSVTDRGYIKTEYLVF